ncbi:MAG: MATE family efflux transporter [Micavibrio aeruginosavorus]|uniref:MATE family efflux transporter n=1 Tax=Micavibrio aeruginosavorus TaxID=349221 RepID=A0A7T5UHD0_9BACT|nr:MAG: MATE family efflux transporter [Micavibrio aeruginosavorus]
MSRPDYSSKGDLTAGHIPQHLVRLTVPMIWGIMAIVSFQLVDTWYISMLGTRELAAISFTFPVTYILFNLVMAQGIATSSVLSRLIGKGNPSRVRRVATHSILFAFISGLLFAALGIASIDSLFGLMGADDSMMPVIRDYMVIWFAGSIFLTTPMVGNSAIRATGDTRTPALIMTIAAVSNALIAPILVFGLWGFPRLEVQGAAMATLLTNIGATIAALYILYYKKKMISRSRWHMALFKDSVKKLLVIAIPVSIASIMQPVAGAVITGLLAQHGAEAVAAFGIASRVEAFSFVIIMALATGMAPIIGQNWGAGLYHRVDETLKAAIRFSVIWSLLVAGLLIAFAAPITSLFTNEPEVTRLAVLFFWIVPATYWLGNLVQGWSSAFNAMGMPRQSFIMIAVKLIVLTIPAAMIGSHLYGVAGIFTALALVNIITGAGFHIMNRSLCQRHQQAVMV